MPWKLQRSSPITNFSNKDHNEFACANAMMPTGTKNDITKFSKNVDET